ncbi:RadC family protein [Desulfonatronovibrio hydrogenovorans]|uniref:RadC family protein n=1 Tax=Desulfonatronovibrio hydrogenovorans TaxID=53245 RepID=UPI00048A6D72|nr:DNA repair protein RadC [Desulfonatronovibrio hydrogenovorans]
MIKTRPHYIGHRKRLRQRLDNDPSQLHDYEILELVLGYALPRKDTKPLAKTLLSRYGNFKEILAAKPKDLESIDGIGQGIISFLKLWQEFWTRTQQAGLIPKTVLSSPDNVVALARSRLQFKDIEEFWTILVDNKNRLISFERICTGTVDQAPVFPREIMTKALDLRASGVILVHNHPGGDPDPSMQDRELTSRIKNLSSEMGIRVLDHIIIAGEKYFSFQEQGYM